MDKHSSPSSLSSGRGGQCMFWMFLIMPIKKTNLKLLGLQSTFLSIASNLNRREFQNERRQNLQRAANTNNIKVLLWHSATAGVELFTAAQQRHPATCVYWQSDVKHLEPDVTRLKMAACPYDTKTLFACFFSLCLSLYYIWAHTWVEKHTQTHSNLVGPSIPTPLYPFSCGLGSTCL